jgi:Protein of unknown function (DUF1559)
VFPVDTPATIANLTGLDNDFESRWAPFYASWGAKISQISDGTSKTLAMLEMLQGEDLPGTNSVDRRGRIWNPVSGTYQVTAFFPPNDSSGWDVSRCNNRPELAMPCQNTNATPEYQARHLLTSRSRHPSGVWALMCDGSAQFVNDSINIIVWRSLSTMKDGEPASL